MPQEYRDTRFSELNIAIANTRSGHERMRYKRRVRRLYLAGLGVKRIARECGVTFPAIYQVLRRMHVPTRPRIPRLEDSVIAQIRSLHAQGEKPGQIARGLGISATSVLKYRH